MGLFSNKDKRCPFCGEATPRLLATKVEGQPLCKKCADKIHMDSELLKQMSLDAVKQHFAWAEENARERQGFSASFTYDGGLFSGKVEIDEYSGRFLFHDGHYGTVFHGSEIRNIIVMEDNFKLYDAAQNRESWDESPVRRYLSRVGSREFVDGLLDMFSGNDKKDNDHYSSPFDHWDILVSVDHPYWSELSLRVGSPSWRSDGSRVAEFESEYESKLISLQNLAEVLKGISPLGRVSSPATDRVSPVVDRVVSASAPAAGDRFCPTCRKMVRGKFCEDCGTATV